MPLVGTASIVVCLSEHLSLPLPQNKERGIENERQCWKILRRKSGNS